MTRMKPTDFALLILLLAFPIPAMAGMAVYGEGASQRQPSYPES